MTLHALAFVQRRTILKCRDKTCFGIHQSLLKSDTLHVRLSTKRSLSSSSKQEVKPPSGKRDSVLFHFLAWYSTKLDTHPLLTKGVTSGLIAGTGDFLCQNFVDERKKTANSAKSSRLEWWDPSRTARFVFLGVFLIAPGIHAWYNALNFRLVPGAATVSTVVKRVVLDQVLFTPLFLPCWLTALWTLEGETSFETMPGRMAEMAPSILVANWALWIPAQLVNFRFVAVKYQVLYSNAVSLIWNIYLSYRATSSGPEIKEEA